MEGSKSRFGILAQFIILALIRGTTPLMAYFAVSNLDSTGLVVAWKSVISFMFFLFSASLLYFVSGEFRQHITENFKDKHTYWKLTVLGIMQSAAPYLLIIYSLKYLPPTLLGVFMAATPWFTILLERLPFVKVGTFNYGNGPFNTCPEALGTKYACFCVSEKVLLSLVRLKIISYNKR